MVIKVQMTVGHKSLILKIEEGKEKTKQQQQQINQKNAIRDLPQTFFFFFKKKKLYKHSNKVLKMTAEDNEQIH